MMIPENEEELAALVAGAKGPLRVVGGGTRPIGRPVTGETLSVSGLTGVQLYEPGALTLVVRAGTPVSEVEAVLAAEGQRLPFEPMDHRVLLGTGGKPTIGGVVAGNVSGPRRIQVGACRDFLLGVRFVSGEGKIIKSGGRVMKNVTGYDLVKLMAGSWGTLGILTEVSFKVLAMPQAEATLIRRGQEARDAVASLSAALGSPYDVSGAAHVAAGVMEDDSLTLIRVEGMAESVRYRAGRLGEGWEIVEGEQSAALWRRLRDVEPFAARPGAVWRVSVKPTDGPVLAENLRAGGLEHAAIHDWGGGLVWLLVEEEGDAGAALIRRQTTALGGHATLVRGSEELRDRVPVFEPLSAPLAQLSRGLKQQFDPRGILNPGLMGE